MLTDSTLGPISGAILVASTCYLDRDLESSSGPPCEGGVHLLLRVDVPAGEDFAILRCCKELRRSFARVSIS